MNGTLAAVIEMSIGLSVLTLIGAVLAWQSLRQKSMLFWALSWLALGARLAFDLAGAAYGASPLSRAGTGTLTAAFAAVPLLGLLETGDRRGTSSRWLWAVPAWGAAWSALSEAVSLPALAESLPVVVPAAVCYPAGVVIILARRPFTRFSVRWPLAAAWLLQGLLLPQYPWMAPGEPLAPVWFGGTGLLTLFTAICLLTLTFQELLRRGQESQAEAVRALQTMRVIIDESPHPIVVLDPDGRVKTWGRAAERVFGWTEREAVGRVLPIISGDNEKEFGELLRATRAGERQSNIEIRRTRRDGSPIYLSLSTTPLKNEGGAVTGALWVLGDLTTHRLYRETIAEQLRLLDSAMDAIIVRGTDERLLYCNSAALKLYGYSREELAALEIRKLILEEDFHGFEEARRIVATTGEWEGELRQRTKDGRAISIHSRWSLVRDEAGLPRARLVINRDISRQKELEVQLRRTQRMESLGALASGIAHDLNNILSPILMSVDILKKRSADTGDQQLLQVLATSVRRGSDIVRQMLTFARGTEGELVPLELRHIVREVETILRETFPKNIAVTIDVPRGLPLVLGDATQIHQLLLNLCVNSRDAMPDGGNIEIRARTGSIDDQQARASGERRGGECVRISVTDDGTGIPTAIRDRIFEPFFTTKEQGKGTGLGLSTVLSIVNHHGGWVTCQSEVGRGTRFDICLPTAPVEQEASPDEPAAVIPLGAGEAVLVIDDDVSILSITRQILESYGYTVFSANSGAAAVELMKDRPPRSIHLVLTDMDMPSMGGAAAVGALRRLQSGVPVIMMSGLAPALDSPEVERLGIEGVIEKPFRAEELLTLVRGVLDAHPPARPVTVSGPER